MMKQPGFSMMMASFSLALFFLIPLRDAGPEEPRLSSLDTRGIPTEWLVCGPFPNVECKGFTEDFLATAGGEAAIVPKEGMEHESSVAEGGKAMWKIWKPSADGIVDFVGALSGKNDVVGYAFCFIPSEEDVAASIELGSDDGVRLWMNDKLVHDNHEHRGLNPGEDMIIARLNKGLNRCLVKVDQGTGGWGFHLRVGAKVKEGEITCEIQPGRFLVRADDGSLRQLATLRVLNTGDETKAKAQMNLDGKVFAVDLGTLPFGWSTHQIELPDIEKPAPATLLLKTDAGETQVEVTITPARKWEIYVVQHTHTDIGYTHLQTEIFKRHGDYIRQVLDFCKQTDDYPEGAKFKWVCETSFTVQRFLETATPEQIEEFVKRVKEGRIEVAAHYLNGTDLECAEELVRKVYYAEHVADKYGFDVVTAMNDDINGVSWAIPSILSRCGVKYLSMGVNYTRSIPVLERPNAFYWEAPDGSKVLAWNAEHYMFGNSMGLHDRLKLVEDKLPTYLAQLEKRGYPYNILGFKMSGFVTDNSPPNVKPCDIIREWNAKYAYPKLIVATSREWFTRLEKEHGKEIPTYKLAWPDWWADGHASSAYETILTRETHETFFAAERFSAIAKILDPSFEYPAEQFRKTLEKIMLYDEHTWGAAQSINQPDSEETKGQWEIKASFATEPYAEARKLFVSAITSICDSQENRRQGTFGPLNSLPWERSGLAFLPPVATSGIRSLKERKVCIRDVASGGEVAYQLADCLLPFIIPGWLDPKHPDGLASTFQVLPDSYPHSDFVPVLLTADVPAVGYKTFRFADQAPSFPVRNSVTFSENKISNRFFEVTLDPITGGIKSIFDKELKKELVDQESPYRLNQYIYETPIGGRAIVDIGRSEPAKFERFSPTKAEIYPGANGPLLGSILVRTSAKNTPEIVQEVILYDFEKRIDIRNTVNKDEVLDAEGVYYAFPFNVRPFTAKTEISCAVMKPGIEQLPGSSSDWHCIQRWADFSNDEFGVTWVTLDAPLVQFSQINTGKWQKELEMKNPAVFSWIMNNYWFTNFKASQGGKLTFRYSLTTHRGPCKNSDAMRFALERANPLILDAGPKSFGSFLEIGDPQAVLLAFKMAENGDGFVLRLWNCEETPTTAKVTFPEFKILSAHSADIVERKSEAIPHAESSLDIPLRGYDIVTAVLDLARK
ncbi:MAG: glycoside hydrolase family 38 C-terminal domain-containing protein [bacterium]|nr:glycoside hydrolase family 38 C-terminal domain-containing protein [bacterium]